MLKRCLGALELLVVVDALSFLDRIESERFLAHSDPALDHSALKAIYSRLSIFD